jgi:hypothetical protein
MIDLLPSRMSSRHPARIENHARTLGVTGLKGIG